MATACGAHVGDLAATGDVPAAPVCLLAATSISSREAHLEWHVGVLSALCETHAWFHAVLNLFDDEPLVERVARAARRHAKIAVERVRGFKTLFWKRVLTPERYGRFTHLWLVDSDMDIAPSRFDLVLLLRVMRRINASIVQPSPYGSGNGFFGYAGVRGHHRFHHVCGNPNLQRRLR